MDKLQTLNNIKKYGIIDAFATVFVVILTTFVNSIYANIIMAIGMIFWILFIKNVAKLYEDERLNVLNIVGSIGFIISFIAISASSLYFPDDSQAVSYLPSNTEISLAFLMLIVIIVFLVSYIILFIVTYRLAKVTNCKLFLYYFYLLIAYSIFEGYIYFAFTDNYEEITLIPAIGLSGFFLYIVMKFYDEKRNLYIKD